MTESRVISHALLAAHAQQSCVCGVCCVPHCCNLLFYSCACSYVLGTCPEIPGSSFPWIPSLLCWWPPTATGRQTPVTLRQCYLEILILQRLELQQFPLDCNHVHFTCRPVALARTESNCCFRAGNPGVSPDLPAATLCSWAEEVLYTRRCSTRPLGLFCLIYNNDSQHMKKNKSEST